MMKIFKRKSKDKKSKIPKFSFKKFLKRTKMFYYKTVNWLKKFAKEIKRVRWPSFGEANKTYLKVVIFVGVIAISLFLIAIGFTKLWDALGVGING